MSKSLPPLLGLFDEQIPNVDDEKIHWSTNKLGGVPNWLGGGPSSYPLCKLCARTLLLVTQIYAPLQGSVYHRALYIFACVNEACSGKPESWLVLRCQQKEQEIKTNIAVKDEWGIGSWDEDDSWGVDEPVSSIPDIDLSALNLQSGQHTAVSSASYTPEVNEPRISSTDIPRFTPFYMAVIDEPQDEDMDMQYENELYREYANREGCVEDKIMDGHVEDDSKQVKAKKKGGKGAPQEKYEKVKRLDEGFYQFKKSVMLCPQQVLRYRWYGEPLLSSSLSPLSTSFETVPFCPNCNSPRVFEMQLLSSVIPKLRIEQPQSNGVVSTQQQSYHDDMTPGSISCSTSNHSDMDMTSRLRTDSGRFIFETEGDRLDFGAVYIFSCSNSCWEDLDNRASLPREEFIVYQADPDSGILK